MSDNSWDRYPMCFIFNWLQLWLRQWALRHQIPRVSRISHVRKVHISHVHETRFEPSQKCFCVSSLFLSNEMNIKPTFTLLSTQKRSFNRWNFLFVHFAPSFPAKQFSLPLFFSFIYKWGERAQNQEAEGERMSKKAPVKSLITRKHFSQAKVEGEENY